MNSTSVGAARGLRVLVLGLTLATAGCLHVHKSIVDASFKARPVAPEDVAVYHVTGPAPPTHTVVALLDAEGDSPRTGDFVDIEGRLRAEAGKLGANAIIVQWIVDRTTRAIAIYIPGPG